jgi:ABC-type multidrug transport system fused ATPase/permease subunit
MNKIGTNILERENMPVNMHRLAAQNQIYSEAKSLFALQFFLNAVVTVLLLVIGLVVNHFWKIKIDWVRSLYGLIILVVDQLIISTYINQLRQKAASIQELFDCDVLTIDWNKVLVGEKPTPEDVNKYYKKYLKKVGNLDEFKNWYAHTISEIDSNAAKVICQRSNYSYDYALRKRFLFWLSGITVSILILLFILSTGHNLEMQSFCILVIIPFMPILSLTFKLYNEHTISVKHLDSLKSNLGSLWSTILKGDEANLETTIRQIQDKFYLNRKSNPLIPDWVFKKMRNGLEEQMYYSVDILIEEYKKSK